MALRFSILVDDQGNPAVNKLGPNANKAEAAIKKLGAAMIAALAVDRLISFGRECIAAFDKSELASTKLRTALGGTSKALLDQAAALQKLTRFGDDNTVEAQAMLATYGLTEEQILRLIPALQDFASATGKDLSEAADLAGRSITTSTNAMKRQGIEIADSTSKGERLDSLLQSLTGRFKGQAEAAGTAGSGGLARMANKYDDLKEGIGACILNFPPFTAAVELANSALDVAINVTGDASGEYKQLADDINLETIPALLDLNLELAKTIEAAPQAGMVLGAIPKFGDPAAIKNLVESFKTVTAEADATKINIADSVRAINNHLANLGKKKGAAGGSDRIAGGGKGAEKSASDLFGMGAVAPNFQKVMQSEMGYGKQLEKLRIEMMKDGQAKEIAQMEDGFNEKHEMLLEAGFTEVQITEMIETQRTKIVADNIQKQIELEQSLLAAKLGAIGNLAAGLGALNTALKGNANASKALGISAAIINTAIGVTSALAEFNPLIPPWVRIANAIAIGAFGAAQVVTIAQQKFNAGGPVYGQGDRDTVPALLTPGEYILNKRIVRAMGGIDAVDRAVKRGGAGRSVTINVNSIIGTKEYVRDNLLPEIEHEISRW